MDRKMVVELAALMVHPTEKNMVVLRVFQTAAMTAVLLESSLAELLVYK
jgi:hypothetical protein